MNILHTEASTGWGGQEIRILREAEGMRERGHNLFFAVATGAQLAQHARQAGFTVAEIPLTLKSALISIPQLISLIRKHRIDIVNTHSSSDAWLGGIAARLTGRSIIRTRHLSTPIRPGWNSRVLYNWLADYTVTTCEIVAKLIQEQAQLTPKRCLSIPTGVNPQALHFQQEESESLRARWTSSPQDVVIGTTCVLRSWKGISDLLKAIHLLRHHPNLKWVIVGEGPSQQRFHDEAKLLDIQDRVIFTGHLSPPYAAMAAMDIFVLLSTANEGVSQATLQAAYLKKPLITTPIGGLPEVCLEAKTGYVVPVHSPDLIADRILKLASEPSLRKQMGHAAQELVLKNFTLHQTLDRMESLY